MAGKVVLPNTRRVQVDGGKWSEQKSVASIKIDGGTPVVFSRIRSVNRTDYRSLHARQPSGQSVVECSPG